MNLKVRLSCILVDVNKTIEIRTKEGETLVRRGDIIMNRMA